MAEKSFHMKKNVLWDHRIILAGWELRAPQSNLLLTVGPALSTDWVAWSFVHFIHSLPQWIFFPLKVSEREKHEKKLYWFKLKNHLGQDLVSSGAPPAGASRSAFVRVLCAWPQAASPDAPVLYWERGCQSLSNLVVPTTILYRWGATTTEFPPFLSWIVPLILLFN